MSVFDNPPVGGTVGRGGSEPDDLRAFWPWRTGPAREVGAVAGSLTLVGRPRLDPVPSAPRRERHRVGVRGAR